MKKSFCLALFILSSACTKVPSQEEVLGLADLPEPAVVTEISYREGGLPVTLARPFSPMLDLSPDFGTGLCASEAEITIKGIFDSEKTQSWTVTGVSSFDISTSTHDFTMKVCLALGASTVTLKTLNKDGNASPESPQISFSLNSKIQTLGLGHPKYPQPGFRTLAGSAHLSSAASGGLQLKNISVSDLQGTRLQATSQSTMTMETGFVNILSQVNP